MVRSLLNGCHLVGNVQFSESSVQFFVFGLEAFQFCILSASIEESSLVTAETPYRIRKTEYS